MRRIVIGVLFLLAVLLTVSFAGAQTGQLRLATGGQGATYHTMGTNMATYCGSGVRLAVQATGGSDDNIERLTSSNRADVAIVQKDILFKRAKINKDASVTNLLAVMPLHYEAMHVVVLHDSPIAKFSDLGSVAGMRFTGFGARAGKRVAAYGGSIESAEIVKAMSGVDYEIYVVSAVDEALKALNDKSADAVVAFGGAPLGWVNDKLSRGKHRLVPFDVPIEKFQSVYRRANITYTRLGVNALPTIATDAVLVTRNFTSPDKVAAVSLLRKCILSDLTRLQEADDTHGQWANVSREHAQVEGWSYFAGAPVAWPTGGGGRSRMPAAK